MLAQNVILSNPNADLTRNIIEEALKKIDQKNSIKNYGIIGLSTTAYILARNLESENALHIDNEEKRLIISNFLMYCTFIDHELLNAIADQARNYLSKR